MDNTVFTSYAVEDRSYLSFVKREIHNLVKLAGFSPMRTGEVDIIVSELASNLIKHAGSGELIYRVTGENEDKAFEIFSMDKGPGIQDVPRMMKDGNSSSNTLGQGLGALNRLSDVFQIYSMCGWGTIAYSKAYMLPKPSLIQVKNQLNIKAVQLCYPGEKVCGDGYFVKKLAAETHIFVGDGLGHGKNAYEAVQCAIEAFIECDLLQPVEVLRYMHNKVKRTRGLVGTVAMFNHEKKQWRICGVGNITTRLYQGITFRNCMPYNGIIGHSIPNTMSDSLIDEEKNHCIVMYSDGIRNRVDITKYHSVLKYDPAVIASLIVKDYSRHNDDTTVLVGKINQ